MLGKFVGQFLPLAGGTLGGTLNLNGNEVALDSQSSIDSDGSGNGSFTGDTFQFYVASTDTNADANNDKTAFYVLSNWTLSGANPSTDFLVNRTVASGSSTGSQLLADFQVNGVSEAHLKTSGVWTATPRAGEASSSR
jgi:hypothetical protein